MDADPGVAGGREVRARSLRELRDALDRVHLLRELGQDRRLVTRDRADVENVRGIGLDVRSGLHTGECELSAGSVRGIAVHTGARVASVASPGEVLVSSTVKDLVAGSGIEFTDRGVHELKGIPGEWRLYAAN